MHWSVQTSHDPSPSPGTAELTTPSKNSCQLLRSSECRRRTIVVRVGCAGVGVGVRVGSGTIIVFLVVTFAQGIFYGSFPRATYILRIICSL